MIKLNTKLPNKLFHIADVHIRNLKRYEEYTKVFERLYKDVEESSKREFTGTIIVGDLVHDKLRITNELIIFTQEFLTKLAEFGPVFVSVGNHDYNENNLDRVLTLDSIIPKLDNVHYIRENDIYEFEDSNIVINNWDIRSKKKDYLRESIKDKEHIILYHGPVDGLTNDDNFVFRNKNYLQVNDFLLSKPKAVLLGDIHKRNVLHENPPIVMVGSTIQQHIRERIKGHGYCLWNTDDWTYEFKDLYNEHIFIILDVLDGVLIEDDKLTKDRILNIRLDIYNTSVHDINLIKDKLHKDYQIETLVENKVNIINSNVVINGTNTLSEESQIQMIKDYMIHYKEEDINNVVDMYKQLSSKLNIKSFTSSKIKLKKLEFHNLFIFGSKPVIIDFSQFDKSIVSITGVNGSGKTSIMSGLSYALFADSDKSSKPADVMNTSFDDYKTNVEFFIDNEEYRITREGERGYKGMVKEFVNFDNITKDISLNGVDRRETNKIIKEYIGDFDLFDLTTISTQNSNNKFINKSSKNMREVLSKILGFDVFEPLEKESYNLQKRSKDIYNLKLSELSNIKIKEITKELGLRNKLTKGLDKDIKNINEIITNQRIERDKLLTKTLNIKTYSEDYQDNLYRNISSYKKTIKNLESKLIINDTEIDNLLIRKNDLLDFYEDYDHSLNLIYKVEIDIEEYNKKIKHQKQLMKSIKSNFDTLKKNYDPECVCSNRKGIVEDIKKATDNYNEEAEIGKSLTNELNKSIEIFNNNRKIIEDNKTIKGVNIDIETLTSNNDKDTLKLEKTRTLLNNSETNLKDYINNKINIDKEKENKEDISKIDNEIKLSLDTQAAINSKIYNNNSSIISYNNTIERHDNLKLDLTKYSKDLKIYTDLRNVVSKDGLGLYMIKHKIKDLTEKINEIINHITTDFTIDILVDDNIDILKVDKYGIKSSMMLASTSQQFITSLGLRIVLSEFGYIPTYSTLLIDEGFSSLDEHSRYKVEEFMKILLKNYDNLLFISHDVELSNFADFNINTKNSPLGSYI